MGPVPNLGARSGDMECDDAASAGMTSYTGPGVMAGVPARGSWGIWSGCSEFCGGGWGKEGGWERKGGGDTGEGGWRELGSGWAWALHLCIAGITWSPADAFAPLRH